MLKQLRGCFLLLITAMIWGSAFVAQSEGMRFVGPFTYNCVRMLLGGLVLLPVIAGARLLRRKQPENHASPGATLKGGLCCGFLLCIASAFQQAGIVHTTAGKAGFITALYVVLVPLFGLFTRKKPPKAIWLCVICAVAGFRLLCIRERIAPGKGDLLVLCCTLFFALHIMTVDRFCEQKADPVLMSCMQFFTAGILLGIGMLLFETPQLSDIIRAKKPILYAGILSCGVAYTLQIVGQRSTPPTLATLLMSLESVFAALSGWLILGERLSVRECLGCILVLTAVVAAQLATSAEQTKSDRKEIL